MKGKSTPIIAVDDGDTNAGKTNNSVTSFYIFLCIFHLAITSFGATLDMGGWLDLSQQGLSPCKR